MDDRAYVALLQWAMPRLGLRWDGFVDVRRQVVRRVASRIAQLDLPDVEAYRARLESDPEEQAALDRLCYVTISRFYRDRAVFEALRGRLLEELAERAVARAAASLRIVSAGCASGEEPYTLAMLWHLDVGPRFPSLELAIVAIDRDEEVLARARRATYPPSSLRELPEPLRDRGLERIGDELVVRPDLRRGVTFVRADLRTFVPEPVVDLVMCRNAVFTYFDVPSQRDFCARIVGALAPRGLLVIGGHERLPDEPAALGLRAEARSIFAKA